MTIRPRKKPRLRWFYARDIARVMGVSRPTACKLLRKIPGAELLYRYDNRLGERWRVSKENYERWRDAQQMGALGTA